MLGTPQRALVKGSPAAPFQFRKHSSPCCVQTHGKAVTAISEQICQLSQAPRCSEVQPQTRGGVRKRLCLPITVVLLAVPSCPGTASQRSTRRLCDRPPHTAFCSSYMRLCVISPVKVTVFSRACSTQWLPFDRCYLTLNHCLSRPWCFI